MPSIYIVLAVLLPVVTALLLFRAPTTADAVIMTTVEAAMRAWTTTISVRQILAVYYTNSITPLMMEFL